MKTIVFAVLLSTACLEPQVSDEVPATGIVLPAGTEVPFDEALDARIGENDNVEALVPLISGFADSAPAHYWDFGSAPEFVAPAWKLVRITDEQQGTFEMLPHPTLFDSVPGDAAYTPFWVMMLLPVTDAYDGELITSTAAIEEAQRLGLIGAPTLMDAYVNCPITARDVVLDTGSGNESAQPVMGYYRGAQVYYFDFAGLRDMGVPTSLDGAVKVPVAELFRLRREGGEPLSEPLRQVDMTGDGDINDSNDILSVYGAYTPLRRLVSVTVPADYLSIDSVNDETAAELQNAEELFQYDGGADLIPISDRIVSFQETGSLRNLPRRVRPDSN